MIPIENKNVVITGANSGIGYHMMMLLLSKGNNILAVDKNIDVLQEIEGIISLQCDVSSKEGVERIFEEASKHFDRIDLFIANAGFTYYESMDYVDWDRVDRIFRTNVYSPIYSYQMYVRHLNGSNGIFAMTDSAMGLMGMPGFTLYTSSKFAINGFQDAIRLENGDNIQLTVLYPVATDTGFFKAASDTEIERPFPLQSPEHVAKMMIKGIERGKKRVFPSRLFSVSMVLFKIFPPIKWAYMSSEKKKFERFKDRRLNNIR